MTDKYRPLQPLAWLLASLSLQLSWLLSCTFGAGANKTATRSIDGGTLNRAIAARVNKSIPIMSQVGMGMEQPRWSRRHKDKMLACKMNRNLHCQRCPYRFITISMMTGISMEATTTITTRRTIIS